MLRQNCYYQFAVTFTQIDPFRINAIYTTDEYLYTLTRVNVYFMKITFVTENRNIAQNENTYLHGIVPFFAVRIDTGCIQNG